MGDKNVLVAGAGEADVTPGAGGGAVVQSLTPAMASFISAQPFFFMATASEAGGCDCSVRGRELASTGRPLPLLKVQDGRTLVFPNYQSNELGSALGNIRSNPSISLLFVDFQRRARFCISGLAEVIDDQLAYADIWPLAECYLQVTVEQARTSDRSRIPRMVMVDPGDTLAHEWACE